MQVFKGGSLNLEHCKELIVLSELLNFSKAAEKLYITQSTLSKHVASAEKEAGFRIFNRTTAHVALTDKGKVYIEYIRQAVEKYELAISPGKNRKDPSKTQIRVAGPLSSEGLMTPLLAASADMHAKGFEIQTFFSDTGVRDVADKVRNHLIDIALALRYRDRESGLERHRVCDIPFGIVCHKTHSLAAAKRVRFEDLVGERLITHPLAEHDDYHNFVGRVCAKHGIAPLALHLEENFLCFPDQADAVVLGVHALDYSRYGDTHAARALDERGDLFTVDVIRRANEADPAICAFFEAVKAAPAPRRQS